MRTEKTRNYVRKRVCGEIRNFTRGHDVDYCYQENKHNEIFVDCGDLAVLAVRFESTLKKMISFINV